MSKQTKKQTKNYDASSIRVLEGLEAVRERPGMYIGGTGSRALHHMVYEVVDNSVDEALGGYCDQIITTIEKDGSVSVEDNGRGIPVDNHPQYNKSAVEVIMTVLHSGGKFGGDGYERSGGLHGVGLSVVNALSKWVDIRVKRDKKNWNLRIEDQKVKGKIKSFGKVGVNDTGTCIQFMPDDEIFDTVIFSYDILSERLKEKAFLNKGLTLTLIDKREDEVIERTFQYEGGISEFIQEINQFNTPIHKDIVYAVQDKDDVNVEFAFQYTTEYNESVFSFANNIRTGDGGTHEAGFKTALSRAINEVARRSNVLKDKEKNLTGDDIREGLVAVISIKLPNPQFEGQTKGKLVNGEIRGIVDSVVYESLTGYFLDNPSILRSIVKKAQEAAKARELARKSREVSKSKNTIDIIGLSSKFAKTTSKVPSECEIYLVEGDSAGGSAKQGRDRYFQAILPLRGKILNTEKEKLSKILSNEEVKSIIAAIGAGIGKDFDVEKVNYHKIVIMTDADIDGEHIRTLLLTFFYRYMKPLFDAGYIYIAKPPLYKLTKGKKVEYAYSDKEKDKIVKQMGGNVTIQRYKGLGEMNPDQLWETTMDPEHRVLIRVTDADSMLSDKLFKTLMGQKVEPRREFIERHSRYANIDTTTNA